VNRRALLALGGAAAAGVALAPGIRLVEIASAQREPAAAGAVEGAVGRAAGGALEGTAARTAGTAAPAGVRWGMLVDANRCRSDCDACVGACNAENGIAPARAVTDAQWIRKVELREARTGREMSLPVMCQHCANPPCVDVCPTGASFKRADGIVLVDRHACIGCRYCVMACPYKARSFVHEPLSGQKPDVPRGKGCVEGCTLCVQRIDRARAPACVEACPQQAIVFGDLADPDSAIALRVREVASVRRRADLGLDTGVRYQGL